MKKLKLFVSNFLVYGFGGIISNIIPFVMVPIITRIMPSTEYFGISDLSTTLVQFGSALAIFGMYDAMYRMFFEKEEDEYRKTVCTTALLFTIAMTIFVFCMVILLRRPLARYVFRDVQYVNVVYLSAMAILVSATNAIISAPCRMQNQRKIFLITNTAGPIIAYLVSIPMLLKGYYIIALPLAAVVSGLSIEIAFFVLNRKWFSFERFNWKLLKQMLIIAVPLVPNFLVYWLFNSCDKLMITNMIGVGAEGVYSVASKIGHCSQLIYTAFAGGWQFFAFSTMNEEDQVKNNSLVFEYLGIIAFLATAFLSAWSGWIFKIFPQEYYEGYIIAPYLFLAPLLQMLFQIAANQFLIIKKTWPNLLILSSGAVLNLILNWGLIPLLGIEGASIATLVGYLVSDMICVFVLCRMKLMVLSKRFGISVLCTVLFALIWRLVLVSNMLLATVAAICLAIIFVISYQSEIKFILKMIRKQ